MMDDIRNHDPMPSAAESAWMQVDGVAAVVRACALAAVALLVGLGASMLVEDAETATGNAVAIYGPR